MSVNLQLVPPTLCLWFLESIFCNQLPEEIHTGMVQNWGHGDQSKTSSILAFQLAWFYCWDSYSLQTIKPNQNGGNWTLSPIHAVQFSHLRILGTVQHAGFLSIMGRCSTTFPVLWWLAWATQGQNRDPWETWVLVRNGEHYCPLWCPVLGMTSQTKNESSVQPQNHTPLPFRASPHPDNKPPTYQPQLHNHPSPTQGFLNHSTYSETLW